MKRLINILLLLTLLALTACVLINPKTLNFDANETSKTFTLTVIGEVEWTITPSTDWITVNPDSGQATSIISVTIDRTGMEDGSHNATLLISTDPNVPCRDVNVQMAVGTTTAPTSSSTTTSPTTTTSIYPGCDPDPVFDLHSPGCVENIVNQHAVCIGNKRSPIVENTGCAGEIFLRVTSQDYKNEEGDFYSDCVVAYMDEEEKRCIGPLYFEDIRFCKEDPSGIVFEFEVEMITVCVRHCFKLKWVPIQTIYAGETSHVRPIQHIRNFIRITWQVRQSKL